MVTVAIIVPHVVLWMWSLGCVGVAVTVFALRMVLWSWLPLLHHVWCRCRHCRPCTACGIGVGVIVPHVVSWPGSESLRCMWCHGCSCCTTCGSWSPSLHHVWCCTCSHLHHVWVAVTVFALCGCCGHYLCAVCGVTAAVIALHAGHHCCYCAACGVMAVVVAPHVGHTRHICTTCELCSPCLRRMWCCGHGCCTVCGSLLLLLSCMWCCGCSHCAVCGVAAAVIAPYIDQGCCVCAVCGVMAVVVCAVYELPLPSLCHMWCRCRRHCAI